MTKIKVFCLACGIAVVLVLPVEAQPEHGFGLFAGLAQYSSETSILGTDLSYDSDGRSFGFDMQVPLTESLTLNAFYMTSSEESDLFDELPITDADVTNEIIGLQLRWWPRNDLYLGGHGGRYRQKVEPSGFLDEKGSGFGFGLAFGFEPELTPLVLLIIGAQYDIAKGLDVLEGFADSDVTGLRAHIGVRFVFFP